MVGEIPAWSGKRGHFNFEYYTLTLVEDETKHVRKGEIAFKFSLAHSCRG